MNAESHIDNAELIVVYRASDPVEAGIVAADLRSEGIDCTISGENQAGFAGVPVVGVEVLVRDTDLEKAQEILAFHESKSTAAPENASE